MSDVIGLYFSAGWCPPCRGFTPAFIDSYEKSLHAKGMRCVLVSWDKDETSFTDYYAKMPWLALPYTESMKGLELNQKFKVASIPTLALVDPQGRTITTEARNAVVQDPTGEGFPWRAPAVTDLAHGNAGRINDLPSLVCLCEATSADDQARTLESLTGVATGLEESVTETEFAFFLGSSGPITAQIRQLCGLAVDGPPRLLLLNIPDQMSYYLGPEGADALAEGAAARFLDDFTAGRLERHQIQPPRQ